ncbi:MAG: diguanylate cyclase domain-containing protein [Microthrixaceae bacterium]
MDPESLRLTGDAATAYARFGERFPIVLVVMDKEMRCTWASPGARSMLGYTPEDLVGCPLADFVHPDDLVGALGLADQVTADPETSLSSPAASSLSEFPLRLRTASGRFEWFDVTGVVLDVNGNSLGVIRSSKESHVLDRVIESLGAGGELTAVLESVVELVSVQFGTGRAWIVHDADGIAEVVERVGWTDDGAECASSVAKDLLGSIRRVGISEATIVRDSVWGIPILSETGESLFGVIGLPAPRSGGPAPLDRYLLSRAARLASVAFARDRDDRLLRAAATTDFLTGVANRRHFESRLAAAAIENGALPLRLLYVDVDDFKVINDTYGHKVGDEVLAAVAARLSACVREEDFVGRLGGDEFAVAAPGLPESACEHLRRRIDESLRTPIAVTDKVVRISASIGLASAHDEDALETILERGDDDMFRSKRTRHPRSEGTGTPSAGTSVRTTHRL